MNPQQPHEPQNQFPPKPGDEFEAASRATAETDEYDDYERHAASYRKASSHPVRKMFIILGVVVLLGTIGGAVYWFLLRDATDKSADTKTSQTADNATNETGSKDAITTKTEHYIANNFSLEFDYPSDWKVAETTGEGVLTVTSPALQLKAATGETATGQIVFTIRDKQQKLPEFDKGNAVAVRASQKINYLKPSSVQRGSTYLSFLQYATSSDGLDGVFITGDYGYQKDQAIPKADVEPVDPRISLAFTECADGVCGENAPLTVSADIWENQDIAKPLTALFQSLTIN